MLIPSCANNIVVIDKEELKESWKLTCVSKQDKFTPPTAESILRNNKARDVWLGEEKCPTKPK